MRSLAAGDVTVEFAPTGPRITGLRIRGGENLLAELPDAVIERPGGRPYRPLGGHRLWRAPEIPEVTYTPDDGAVVIEREGTAMRARGAPDPDGVVKEIAVTITGDGEILVEHRLVNTGDVPVDVAPWSITQFPPAGTAVLPVVAGPETNGPYRPDRSVVLWPYTDPGAEGLHWAPGSVTVTAGDGSRQKLGAANHLGWLAYHRDPYLFVKSAAPFVPSERHVDRDATAQIYRDHRVVELETLGPLVTLGHDAAVTHRETWRVLRTGLLRPGEVFDVAASATTRFR